jgi:Fe-S-cluster-containing dehydrogenase component
MKKCTLCIDRIENQHLPPEDRLPACVSTCPASARHFGDLGDPNSDVSQLVAERGGYDLMPEMGMQPVNKYLPPRASTRHDLETPATPPESLPASTDTGSDFLNWVDRMLTR